METGSWRVSDAEVGAIIENCLDEAYMLSWPGPLEIWVPVHDTGGYDRARAPLGSYDFRLDQIKGTCSLHSGNQVQISFYTPALHRHRNLYLTFVYYDLKMRTPVDPVWKIPSEEMEKVCKQVPGLRGNHWIFVANRSGVSRDPAARYQIGLNELAGSNGWSVLPASSLVPTVSEHPVESNTFFKVHFDAALLQAASGDEMLLAARPDVFGRHRLIFSKSTGEWISLSIHGGTRTGATGLIQANIHRSSFVAHPRHYILIEHYDASASDWYQWAWLIRSDEFEKLARGQGAYLLFTTTLNAHHMNRWTPSRVLTTDVPKAVLAALHRRHLRKAA